MSTPNPTAIDPRIVEQIAQQADALGIARVQISDIYGDGVTNWPEVVRFILDAYTKATSMPVVGTAGEG